MEELEEDNGFEVREELMISPNGGPKPTKILGHFLKPCINSIKASTELMTKLFLCSFFMAKLIATESIHRWQNSLPFPSSTENIHRTHCPFLHRHWHSCSPRFTEQPPLTRQPQTNHNPTAIFLMYPNQNDFDQTTATQPQPNCNLPCKLKIRTKKKEKSLNQKHNPAAIFLMYHNQNHFVHSKSEQTKKKIQAETVPLRERRKRRSKGSTGLKKEEEEGCKPKPKRLHWNQNKEQKNLSRNVVVQYRLKKKKLKRNDAVLSLFGVWPGASIILLRYFLFIFWIMNIRSPSFSFSENMR